MEFLPAGASEPLAVMDECARVRRRAGKIALCMGARSNLHSFERAQRNRVSPSPWRHGKQPADMISGDFPYQNVMNENSSIPVSPCERNFFQTREIKASLRPEPNQKNRYENRYQTDHGRRSGMRNRDGDSRRRQPCITAAIATTGTGITGTGDGMVRAGMAPPSSSARRITGAAGGPACLSWSAAAATAPSMPSLLWSRLPRPLPSLIALCGECLRDFRPGFRRKSLRRVPGGSIARKLCCIPRLVLDANWRAILAGAWFQGIGARFLPLTMRKASASRPTACLRLVF